MRNVSEVREGGTNDECFKKDLVERFEIRKNVADALINGKAIEIRGGNFVVRKD